MLLLVGALSGACGGDGGDSGAAVTNKAGWTKQHGSAIQAVSVDLDAARDALSKGDRPVILSSCNQLQEDMADARKAVPVPDPTVDGVLRTALDAISAGIPECLQGARVASQARITEAAIAKFKDARPKMDAANAAIAAWK